MENKSGTNGQTLKKSHVPPRDSLVRSHTQTHAQTHTNTHKSKGPFIFLDLPKNENLPPAAPHLHWTLQFADQRRVLGCHLAMEGSRWAVNPLAIKQSFGSRVSGAPLIRSFSFFHNQMINLHKSKIKILFTGNDNYNHYYRSNTHVVWVNGPINYCT